MKSYLILVRHGESRWNIANKFTGWVDVPLSEVGVHEAMITARRLEDLQLDVAFTSTLTRAQETLNIILSEQKYTGIYLHSNTWRSTWFLRYNNKAFEKNEIPVHVSDKLNERYYGKLQGLNKDAARKTYGKEKVHVWRRSYAIPPPGGESLKAVVKRAVPYFKSKVMKHVKAHQNVLVAAHGNSLRAIIKHIENISDEDIPHLELETGKPIIYEFEQGKLTLLNHVHGFDRPTQWHEEKKHARNYASKTKKVAKRKAPATKSSTSKKKVAKKKVTAKKKNPTRKKTTVKRKAPVKKKKASAKKRVTKKVTKKKTATKKPVKKGTKRKAPTKKKTTKKKVVKRAPARKKAVKKKVTKKKVTKKKKAKRKTPTKKKKTTTKKSTRQKKAKRRR